MENKQKIGKIGETAAAEYLVKQGYDILERNWRYHKAEIDIITKHENLLVFVEVKTRQSDRHGKPEDTVSFSQQKMIVSAAHRYMDKIDYDWAVQFDVIGILVDTQGMVVRLNHYEDAFY